MTKRSPLSGVRVLDLGQYAAGPMATLLLADLGADVVKVEPPGKGDAFRTFGLCREGVSAFWLNVNRGKRSVTLDLKDPAGAAWCLQLAARADVLLVNSRPGALDSLGLDDATLARRNPSLVRVYITGYGPTGPRAAEPVFDNLVQGLTGLAAFQGGSGSPDMLAPMVADKTTAILVAQAATAALYERQVTGHARRVEVSLLDACAYWNFPDLFADRTFLADNRRSQRLPNLIVATTDGRVVLAPVSGSQIRRTAEALGHPEWVPEFKALPDMTLLARELVARAEPITARMTTSELLDRLRRFDVPAGPVLDLEGHLDEPQVIHNRLYETEHDPELGPVRVVRSPATFDGELQRAPFTVPAADEDPAAIVEEWADGPGRAPASP